MMLVFLERRIPIEEAIGVPLPFGVPIVLFSVFAGYNAPKLDKHLAEHYGAELEAYARSTRKLIPFIY
jgi:protein-S-isoprenylcysteine O-methyltransferase Ste14